MRLVYLRWKSIDIYLYCLKAISKSYIAYHPKNMFHGTQKTLLNRHCFTIDLPYFVCLAITKIENIEMRREKKKRKR